MRRARLRALASHELHPNGVIVLTAHHYLNGVSRIQGRFNNREQQVRPGSRWNHAFVKSDGQATTSGNGYTAQLPARFIQCQSTFRDIKSSKLTAFGIHRQTYLNIGDQRPRSSKFISPDPALDSLRAAQHGIISRAPVWQWSQAACSRCPHRWRRSSHRGSTSPLDSLL